MAWRGLRCMSSRIVNTVVARYRFSHLVRDEYVCEFRVGGEEELRNSIVCAIFCGSLCGRWRREMPVAPDEFLCGRFFWGGQKKARSVYIALVWKPEY